MSDGFRRDAEPIAGRIGAVELGPKIALRRLDVLVAEGELDLLQRCLATAGQLGDDAH
jgi:hypothetical protein